MTAKFNDAFRRLRGKAIITEKNVADAMAEVRTALLEADVNYRVVRDFVGRVQKKALGERVLRSVSPAQQFVKIVHDELVELMGPVEPGVPKPDSPTVIMLAGLQGSGKTTTAAKLAGYLLRKGRRSLMVAADVRRPAAVEQLKVLGGQLDIEVFSGQGEAPDICVRAVERARLLGASDVIIDTAGRLHIDDEMMKEAREIAERAKPHQVYLVCDAMTGQDAVNSAKAFDEQLALDGVILTKLDGDARGGAALSVKAVTGKPIKFVGVGEKLDKLEEFHPERMADRILGMGDVVSLVEKARDTIDAEEAARMQEKMLKAEFTLDDFLKQLGQVRRMGGIREILAMVPGVGSQVPGLDVSEGEMKRVEAIIRSMTPQERTRPDTIDGSRRRRIAIGSGTAMEEVSGLLKQFRQMRDMMKAIGGGKIGPGALTAMLKPGARIRPHKKRSKRKRMRRKRR
ncbi:MAG: signal recognition particle protein [Planctomycetota bacterium]|jgi:signal recognition particle subunit SRP54